MAAAIVTVLVALLLSNGGQCRSFNDKLYKEIPDLFNDEIAKLFDQREIKLPPPTLISEWPGSDVRLGQVSGVAVDANNEVVLFHRGSREWDGNSFDMENRYINADVRGPIKEKTLIRVDPITGHAIEEFGADKYFMPHGLNIDHEGNMWVTDVGLHQVMKIPKGHHEPTLTLGTYLTPGNDDKHFCKPTDVAVAKNGEFFVSDGYCNGRIMKFDKNGKLLTQWGKMYTGPTRYARNDDFYIPHSVTLIENKDLLCVGDREHGRIQCFKAGLKRSNDTGLFMFSINNTEFGKLFALTYDPTLDVIYAVNGGSGNVSGFTLDLSGKILERWSPFGQGFQMPHDVAVSPSGTNIYVGEIHPDRVTKFQRIPI